MYPDADWKVSNHRLCKQNMAIDVLPALKDGDSFESLRGGEQRTVPADGPEAPCKGTATSRLTAQAMRSFSNLFVPATAPH